MFTLVRSPEDHVESSVFHFLTVESLDAESLLVDWLNELLYLHETTGEIYTQFTVKTWIPTRLEATVGGGPPHLPPIRHIKAVTYHQLRVSHDAGGWTAQVYFDI
jgi:SHS2 domain-containing protein